MRAKLRPVLLPLVLVLLAGGLAACGADSDTEAAAGGPKIVVGSFSPGAGGLSDAENEILARLYGTALEHAGATVSYRKVGNRESAVSALEKGEVDLVAEYLGGLVSLFEPSPPQGRHTPEALKAVQAAAAPRGLTVAEASHAEDGEVIAVTKAFAGENRLTTISNLKGLPGPFTLAGPPECATSGSCILGLRNTYGLNVGLTTGGPDDGGAEAKKALQDGTAQIGRLFSSDPAANKGGKFVILEDDALIHQPGNVVPLLRTVKATPAVLKVINKVSEELDTEKLAELNESTEKDGKSPAAAAEGFFSSEKV